MEFNWDQQSLFSTHWRETGTSGGSSTCINPVDALKGSVYKNQLSRALTMHTATVKWLIHLVDESWLGSSVENLASLVHK